MLPRRAEQPGQNYHRPHPDTRRERRRPLTPTYSQIASIGEIIGSHRLFHRYESLSQCLREISSTKDSNRSLLLGSTLAGSRVDFGRRLPQKIIFLNWIFSSVNRPTSQVNNLAQLKAGSRVNRESGPITHIRRLQKEKQSLTVHSLLKPVPQTNPLYVSSQFQLVHFPG